MSAKRARSAPLVDGALDEQHPVVAFHREAWVGDYWHVMRETFRAEYEAEFEEPSGHSEQDNTSVPPSKPYQRTIEEPKKFWRHCREALAKWVLSQTARYSPQKAHTGNNHEEAVVSVDYAALSSVQFLPSEVMLQSNEGLRSFDDQLIRDLTFKSIAAVRNDEAFIKAVTAFVVNFGLARRCVQAVKDVNAHVASMLQSGATATAPEAARHSNFNRRGGGPPSQSRQQWLRPMIRRISEEQKTTPTHHRIQGALIEVGVRWPEGYTTDAVLTTDHKLLSRTHVNVRPVLVPEASWHRLQRCYAAFGATRDAKQYATTSELASLDPDSVMEAFCDLRCAVVVLRYEHCLASGSLQLCADSALKVSLNTQGYNVMDLCASPINAYMVDITPSPTGTGSSSSSPQVAPVRGVAPRRFCSAFWDTDSYFGSMGSALLFTAETTYHAFRAQDEALLVEMPLFRSLLTTALHREPSDAPLLLTLDVPYDEDLCELLFLKLAHDSAAAVRRPNAPKSATAPAWVDYVLVLPLWWNVPFHPSGCPKRFITEGGESVSATDAAMWALVQKHSDYLQEGKRIHYKWLEELPQSMIRSPPTQEEEISPANYSAVFDGVFIRESYTYFCTATNKPLSGVTATEVIGVSLKRSLVAGTPAPSTDGHHGARVPDLRRALFEFYSVS